MIAVLGLGNPGRAYARTRHNVGSRCVERLARRYGIPLRERLRHAMLGRGCIGEQEVVLAKPRTYMNRSGVAARYLLERYHLAAAQLLVVCDDMDLPLGKLRLRSLGSSGGHRGLDSIISELGTQEFPRLRIGIGRPPGQDTISFVLEPFTPEEAAVMQETTAQATEAIVWVLQHGLESAMNRFNG